MVQYTAIYGRPIESRTPSFKVMPFFDAEYIKNGTTFRHCHWNTNRDLYTPYATLQQCHFEWPWV